jgi:hypothetical protein
VRFREWLIVSALGDDLSGRVLEYSWHSMFLKLLHIAIEHRQANPSLQSYLAKTRSIAQMLPIVTARTMACAT